MNTKIKIKRIRTKRKTQKNPNRVYGIKRIRIVLNTNNPNDAEFDVKGEIFNFENIKIMSGYPLFSDRFIYDEGILNELCSNVYSNKVALFFDKNQFKQFLSRCKIADTEKAQMHTETGFLNKNIMIMLNSFFPISFPKSSFPISVANTQSIVSTFDRFKKDVFGIADFAYLKNKYTVTQVVWLNTLQTNPAYSRDLNEDLEIYKEKSTERTEEIKEKLDSLIEDITEITDDSKIKSNVQKCSVYIRLYLLIIFISACISNTSAPLCKNYEELTNLLFINLFDNTDSRYKVFLDIRNLSGINLTSYQPFLNFELDIDIVIEEMDDFIKKNVGNINISKTDKLEILTEYVEALAKYIYSKPTKSTGVNINSTTIIQSLKTAIGKKIQKYEDASKIEDALYNWKAEFSDTVTEIKDQLDSDNFSELKSILNSENFSITDITSKLKTDKLKKYAVDLYYNLKLLTTLSEITNIQKLRDDSTFWSYYIRKEKFYIAIAEKYQKLKYALKPTNEDIYSALFEGDSLDIDEYLEMVDDDEYTGIDEINMNDQSETKPSVQIHLYCELVGGRITPEVAGLIKCPYASNRLGEILEKLLNKSVSYSQFIDSERKYIDLNSQIQAAQSTLEYKNAVKKIQPQQPQQPIDYAHLKEAGEDIRGYFGDYYGEAQRDAQWGMGEVQRGMGYYYGEAKREAQRGLGYMSQNSNLEHNLRNLNLDITKINNKYPGLDTYYNSENLIDLIKKNKNLEYILDNFDEDAQNDKKNRELLRNIIELQSTIKGKIDVLKEPSGSSNESAEAANKKQNKKYVYEILSALADEITKKIRESIGSK